jgi:hypothetical protein
MILKNEEKQKIQKNYFFLLMNHLSSVIYIYIFYYLNILFY